ncbi:MAG: peptide chain release factor N(5)-glutamine methyltransferase [Pseudomonadota bacterium]
MKNNPATIATLLQQATQQLHAVSASARLDAEVLMAHCLNKDRAYLFTWPERTPKLQQTEIFLSLVAARARGVPVAHLTGKREFWSMDFIVSDATLIPRPDTETLVEVALQQLSVNPGPVLDLGTGSGIIAICIASEKPALRVDAVDNSEAALAVARQNAAQHQVNVNFVHSNWFSKVRHTDYTIVVSNPPYLAEQDEHLHLDGLQHEPRSALVADDDGMAAIRHIVTQVSQYTAPDASVLIEHGHTQGAAVRALMQAQGFHKVTTCTDLESRERVTLGTVNQSKS